MNINDFIERYIGEEPVTKETIAWSIRKYIYVNYFPNQTEKLEKYETFMKKFSKALLENDQSCITNMLKRLKEWGEIRNKSEFDFKDRDEYNSLLNETFYNLLK